MEITRQPGDGWMHLVIEGRLDGYWADHLDAGIAETIRDGYYRLRLDLGGVPFMSSAGIAVLVKYHKQLTAIRGHLIVSKLSPQVRTVLEITHLVDILVDETPVDGVETQTTAGATLIRGGLLLQVYTVPAARPVTCQAVASSPARPLPGTAGAPVRISCTADTLAVGIGALGTSDAECRGRYGELLAAGGAAIYLPADGTETPDYVAGAGSDAPDVRLLNGIAVDGRPGHLVRFEPTSRGGAHPLSEVMAACLHATGSDAIALAMVAETDGLVGAALREAPDAAQSGQDFFGFPGIRRRLTYTAGRALARSMALVVGVAQRERGPLPADFVRPLGAGLTGHFHAAAFPFQAIKKGRLDLHATVDALVETGITGVLHLVTDDRPIVGAGESEFVSGACWIASIGGAP